ncbi:MAG: TIM barrel protein [Pseudonocardia sp.]
MSVSARPGPAPQAAARTARTGLATVCISGTLEDKLAAAAAAGFDGVEIFDPDLVASASSPAEVRARCRELGLTIDLFQPFRDFDTTRPEVLTANLRRAERKFDVMAQLGTDLLLVCSSVSPDALDDDDAVAEQLHGLAERAARRGLRICYEALAWGTFVNTYDRSWEIVRRADHPALGVCLDSFHILSRGSDPAGIEDIPGEKIFFLQLADAPHMDMDVLQWSRHYRLFPGQGTFDLAAFLGHVLTAGYTGPLSLEIFNDVFRQSDPARAALDARRSLLALQEETAPRLSAEVRERSRPLELPAPPQLRGHAFVELAADGVTAAELAHVLHCLGFTRTGVHRSKPVELWEQGDARVLLTRSPDGDGGSGSGRGADAAAVAADAVGSAVAPAVDPAVDPAAAGGAVDVAEGADKAVDGAAIAALGLATADPAAAARRATALLAPVLPRLRGPQEAELPAVAAPDGTSMFFCGTDTGAAGWRGDFAPQREAGPGIGLERVDHVALTQPFDHFDEAALFYRSVLGLRQQYASEVAAPFGLVRNRTVSDPGDTVHIGLSVSVLRRGSQWHPRVTDPQHVAFHTSDLLATARAARAAGAPILPIPANYYDDVDARLAPPPELLRRLRELHVLYDRDAAGGEFLHLYTVVLGGRVFLELVQRIGGYRGYGEINAPVRMAAHRRLGRG